MKTTLGKRRQIQAGFSYVECALGALLLSICLIPAFQAINDNIARRNSLQNSERDMRCLLRTKERVFALSFTQLLGDANSTHSAGKFFNPTTYSEAPTAACPLQRNVYILRYNTKLADPFATTLNDMVYVRIEQDGGASLATLMIPQ